MFKFTTGLLEKTRLMSNILMFLLLIGNIFFSVQYTERMKEQVFENQLTSQTEADRAQISHFLKFFIDTVINTQGTVSFDDRVKLENDIRQIHNPELTKQWEDFVGSKDSKTAQQNAVKLMSMLVGKMV
ncbi:MAG: hypothetical protein JWO73_293 [Candidatus Taylorbacteria bacterium]|nr:hypothetical protein [Candidatus Taylorbacteria bacterium]